MKFGHVVTALVTGIISVAVTWGIVGQELQVRYDEGMRAGVEYQEWFCENPEYAG
jgi:hypothetical protein